MNSKLDPYHLQIVAFYFKTKQDFLNIIQVKKQFRFLLDKFTLNPIPITKETKNLFQHIDTQQFFGKFDEGNGSFKQDENEIELKSTKIFQ